MSKDWIYKLYNVNVNNVKFERSANGLYEFSTKSERGLYIIKEKDDYEVVAESTNTVVKFTCDLSGIEG